MTNNSDHTVLKSDFLCHVYCTLHHSVIR